MQFLIELCMCFVSYVFMYVFRYVVLYVFICLCHVYSS